MARGKGFKNPTIFNVLANIGNSRHGNGSCTKHSLTNKPSAFRRSTNGEWIADTQLIVDQQSVLHILGVQCFTSTKKSGGYDHCIVHA
jgi:hypothetical protein